MAITIASTAAALNQHAVLYAPDISQKLRVGLVTEENLTAVVAERTYAAPNAEVNSLVQAYQTGFTPNLTANFDAVENTLQNLKVDIQFSAADLDQYYDSWMVEWDERGKSRLEYSFPKYLYEQVMLPKIVEDLELRCAYKGVYAAPTPGTAGTPATAVDGLGKKIADAITANILTPIATGALSASTMVEKVETFCDGLPLPYRDMPGDIYMSPSWAIQYGRDYRNTFGTGNGLNINTGLLVDHTGKKIVPLPSMEGTSRMIFSPKGNLIFGIRRGQQRLPVIRWQEFERTLKGLAEFSRFYGVKFWGHVHVNDQA
jgi:hypothetical protein